MLNSLNKHKAHQWMSNNYNLYPITNNPYINPECMRLSPKLKFNRTAEYIICIS